LLPPNKMWGIVVEPLEGFTHLSNEIGQQEAAEKGEKYHVSICFAEDIDAEWKKKQLTHLLHLYGHPVKHTFHIARVTSGASVEISHDDSVYKNCIELFRSGYYKYKSDLHISM